MAAKFQNPERNPQQPRVTVVQNGRDETSGILPLQSSISTSNSEERQIRRNQVLGNFSDLKKRGALTAVQEGKLQERFKE